VEGTDATMTASCHVTLKWAQTLDGRIATKTGSSRWISGPGARVEAHALRAAHAAILVGIGTVLADDPALTVRHVPGNNPLRVVVDSKLRTPYNAQALRTAPWVLATAVPPDDPRRWRFGGCSGTVLHLPGPDDTVDLGALFDWLGRSGDPSVLVEGGSRIITACLHRQLAHAVAVFLSPKVVGGGIPAVVDLGFHSLSSAIHLRNVDLRVLGPDALLRGRVEYTGAPDRHSYTLPA